jgi:hypothetical protein
LESRKRSNGGLRHSKWACLSSVSFCGDRGSDASNFLGSPGKDPWEEGMPRMPRREGAAAAMKEGS